MQNIYSVSWVNAYIRNMISQDFMLQSLYVKGEASNVKYHSSGHLYFTLKDKTGAIACVMFAGNRNGLAFQLENGMQIVAGGNVDVYERDGKYQFYAKEIKLEGKGNLYEKFEQLKKDLEEMGMFDPVYKQKIPKYIHKLGVVTAPTGAAVRDIIQIAKRRNKGVEIILYPAIVQGDMAKASIVQGIKELENLDVDVIIVGRGGGSIEDLWAFNEESVARAIFDCSVPVISAVGHETDVTIADFVADLRAPTPSAAAELAVWDLEGAAEKLEHYAELLYQRILRKIKNSKLLVANYRQRLLLKSPDGRLKEQRMRLLALEQSLEECMDQILMQRKHQLAILAERLDGLSPLKKLSQGYAFAEGPDGTSLTDVHKLHIGDAIRVYIKNGKILAQVTETESLENQYGKEADNGRDL